MGGVAGGGGGGGGFVARGVDCEEGLIGFYAGEFGEDEGREVRGAEGRQRRVWRCEVRGGEVGEEEGGDLGAGGGGGVGIDVWGEG